MSRFSFIIPVLGICLFITLPAAAQQTQTSATSSAVSVKPVFTMDELVQLALDNNLQPEIAQANLEAAHQRAKALGSWQNPELEIVAGLASNAEAQDEEVILSQPIDLFGQRRAEREVLKAKAQSAEAKSTFVRRSLIAAVKNAAVNLFAAQESNRLATAQVDIAQQFYDAAKRRAELGEIAPIQAQRAHLELERMHLEQAKISSEATVRLAVLNQLTGNALPARLRINLPEIVISANPQHATETSTETINRRPDIAEAKASVKAWRAKADAIGKQRLPKVELQARRSAFFGHEGSYGLRAVFSMPLFDFGSIEKNQNAAQAEAKAEKANLQWLQSQARLQVKKATIQLQQKRASVERYQNTIVPQTLDLVRKTQIGFDAGASTYLEVLDAQRTLRMVQFNSLDAMTAYRLADIELHKALGVQLIGGMHDES